MPTLPIDVWSAESLRLTVFPTVTSPSQSSDWWKLVTGDDPSEITTNPKRGMISAEGSFRQGKLAFKSMMDRMDWFFVARDHTVEEVLSMSSPPKVGPLIESMAEFSEGIERWLATPDLPEVARIAFGGAIVHPIGDRKEAYIQLRDYIPVKIDPESKDILYQINLPGESSTIQGLGLNRLSKWFVGTFSLVTFPVVQTVAGVVMQDSLEMALRVELDINTIPTFQAIIPKEHLIGVFRELLTISKEIVTSGVGRVDQ
jgi:hypothetical protein